MLVTGVQAAGAKGVSALQGTVVDLKQTTRAGVDGERDGSRAPGTAARSGDPQPVVFPRSGVPMDQRPVALRQLQAVARYQSDGDADHDNEHDDHPDAA
jgi:hypothetical protein